MPQPRLIDDTGRAEIKRVAELRASIPSDKDLAKRMGCSVNTIKWWMHQFRPKPFVLTVSCETDIAHDDDNSSHAGAVCSGE